ncbi:MAG: hypothetical protein ACE5EO_02375 [Candidatus Krumholzibacteriia bacterium]
MTTRRGHTISFDGTWFAVLDMSYEDAWSRVLRTLDWHEWPVESQVEESGTITTATVNVGVYRDKYACQKWSNVTALRCQLTVHVGPLPGNRMKIRVTARLEGKVFYPRGGGFTDREVWRICESTGKIESEFFDTFLSRL